MIKQTQRHRNRSLKVHGSSANKTFALGKPSQSIDPSDHGGLNNSLDYISDKLSMRFGHKGADNSDLNHLGDIDQSFTQPRVLPRILEDVHAEELITKATNVVPASDQNVKKSKLIVHFNNVGTLI